MQKFLPIFCNFFITIKKSIQYKLIEVFSFSDFFPSFRNSSSSTAEGRSKRFLSLISKLSFLNRLNQFAHILSYITFSSYVSQIILCASATLFFYVNKTKDSGEYALYLLLIVLNIRLCHYLCFVMHKCRNANLQKS